MDIQERINKLMEQKEFAEAFSKTSTAQEVVDLFGRNGVEVPLEIAEELFIPAIHMDGELNEDALDDVAGGVSVTALWVFSTAAKGIKKIAKTCWNAGKKLANWEDDR